LPVDLLAVANRLVENDEAPAAWQYLSRYAGTAQDPSPELDQAWFTIFSAGLADAYVRVGVELARQQQFSDAENSLQAALHCQADHWDALAALASLHSQRGRKAEALANFERMLALRPRDAVVANNVAWILATNVDEKLRDPQRALELAETVCRETNRRVPTALDTLAAAYAANGRFEDAASTANEALKLLGTSGSPPAVEALRRRLDSYNRREAVRE
jgi:Flp pilus assembly protein TadD